MTLPLFRFLCFNSIKIISLEESFIPKRKQIISYACAYIFRTLEMLLCRLGMRISEVNVQRGVSALVQNRIMKKVTFLIRQSKQMDP